MKRYELVMIDADDTLFDFRRAERVAFAQALTEHGLDPAPEVFSLYGEINHGLWKALERGETTQEKLKVERFARLVEAIAGKNIHDGNPETEPGSSVAVDAQSLSASYIAFLSRGTFLLEGAEELCQHLAGDYRLVIVTNGIAQVQRPRFEGSAIRRYIDHIVISEEQACSKPCPDIFEAAANLAGIREKSAMIMIGDSLESDIRGGAAYGIDTCWFNPGGKVNTSGILPTYEVRSLKEIQNFLPTSE